MTNSAAQTPPLSGTAQTRFEAGDLLGGLTGTAVALPQSMGLGIALYATMGLDASAGAMAGLLGAAALSLVSGLVGATIGMISAPNGPVTMLNLLRFRERADYSDHPDLAPPEPITGRQAYDRYIEHTLPFLTDAGGSVLYSGSGGHLLIGPEDQRWDMVLLVRHASVEAFLAMATNQRYLTGIGHRVAALQDSRLVPLEDLAPISD